MGFKKGKKREQMKRIYTIFIALIIVSYGVFPVAKALETNEHVYFVIVTPDSATAGQSFLTKIIAKDKYGRIISNYNKIGKNVEIITTGTGIIKPSLIPASSFKNGTATIECIYDKAEDFNIRVIEKPIPEEEIEEISNATRITIVIIVLFFIFVIAISILWYRERKVSPQKEFEPEAQEELVRKKLITHLDPRSSVSEAYRGLRTNILSFDIEKPIRTLLVTSALPGEGKTTVVTNLAITFANLGNKVLLVDAALRRPLIDKIFELDRTPGLVEILTGGLRWTEAMNSTGIDNLTLITSGKLPFNPSEILSSIKMKELIEEFKSQFDIILFDSSDVIGVTDPAVLGSKVDGVLLVVQTGKTQRETVLRAQSLLESARARILGYVLDQINTSIPAGFDRYLVRLEPKL